MLHSRTLLFIYQVLNSIKLGIPQRRIPGEGNVSPLQYSNLENSMDRGAWWATVHGITRVRYDLATKPGEELGFPGGSEGKESAFIAGDLGSIPGLGRSPGEGNDNPLQYSCLENPVDRGAWGRFHGVAKSRT